MKEIVSRKTSGIILIICLLTLMVFHILVILKILPSNIVWDGQMDNGLSVLFLEIAALVLTAFFILIAAAKTGYIKSHRLRKAANAGIWVIVVFFSFNIAGNLMAKTYLEKLVFTPLSILMVICSIRLATKSNIKGSQFIKE